MYVSDALYQFTPVDRDRPSRKLLNQAISGIAALAFSMTLGAWILYGRPAERSEAPPAWAGASNSYSDLFELDVSARSGAPKTTLRPSIGSAPPVAVARAAPPPQVAMLAPAAPGPAVSRLAQNEAAEGTALPSAEPKGGREPAAQVTAIPTPQSKAPAAAAGPQPAPAALAPPAPAPASAMPTPLQSKAPTAAAARPQPAPPTAVAPPSTSPAPPTATEVAVPLPSPRPPDLRAPTVSRAPVRVEPRPAAPERTTVVASNPPDNRGFFEKMFSLPQPPKPTLGYAPADSGLFGRTQSDMPTSLAAYDRATAVYDISAHTVYLPDGTRLEAHSGLGPFIDDPRHVNLVNRGSTPPHIYDLEQRGEIFHGVRAIRLNPEGGGGIFGRDGILAHTYMLGPRGDSNGCVSFKNYNAFLQAYLNGQIKKLAVVARLN